MKNEKTKISLLILTVILLFLFFLLWRQYENFQRTQGIQNMRGNIAGQVQFIANLRRHGPLTAAETSYIQSWMTFDYIDTAYKVPPSYLKTALNISPTNTQYPHISIAHYARENNLNVASVVGQIATAVSSYIAASSSSSASSAAAQ